jgi:acetyl esterase/lipase
MKNTTLIDRVIILLSIGILMIIMGCNSTTDHGTEDTTYINSKWVDISYAQLSAAQKLDIYLPSAGSGPFPVIIQIHGGGFATGDKSSIELTTVSNALDRGYAVVAVNYRLSGEAQFPAQINDIKAAIRFLRANASTYNLDPERFAIWGGSAGGYLSALAGTSGDVKTLQDDSLGNSNQSDRVQAVVDWYGPVNFSTIDAEFAVLGITPNHIVDEAGSCESLYLGKTIGTVEAETLAELSNPTTYISADDPPFLIQHGTLDDNVPVTQSIDFAFALKRVLGNSKVTLTIFKGAGHGGAEFDSTENITIMLDFLDATLK